MITPYLYSAWRHYVRYKFSTIANVLCLTFGFVCFLCAYSVFAVFQSAESGFSQSNRIYTIKTQVISAHGNSDWFAGIPYRMIKYLKSDLTAVEALSIGGSAFVGTWTNVSTADGGKVQTGITSADDQFFKLFDIRFLRGDRDTALRAADDVVLGKAIALKLFDSIDVIGKTLTINDYVSVKVTGVMDALPVPTHLTTSRPRSDDGKYYLGVVASHQVVEALSRASTDNNPTQVESKEDVQNSEPLPNTITYLMLPRHGIDIDALNAKLQAIADRSIAGQPMRASGEKVSYRVEAIPLKELLTLITGVTSRIFGLPLLSMVIFFGTAILLAAILNYINVSTTQAIANQKELGIQRLVGAARKHIVVQTCVETLIICSLATVFGFFIFENIRTQVVRYSHGFVDFQASWLSGWRFAIAVTLSLLVVTLVAALYPMLRVAHTTPMDSVRSSSYRASSRILSQVLVAMQFAIAAIFLFVMTAVQQQAATLEHAAIGKINNPVVFIRAAHGAFQTLDAAGVDYQTLATQLKRHPEIEGVALADTKLWVARAFITATSTGISTTNDNSAPKIMVASRRISSNFFAVMNIDLLAGKSFDPAMNELRSKPTAAEITTSRHEDVTQVIVGRAVVDALGYKNPQEIIGRDLYDHREVKMEHLTVIGVVADHFEGYDGAHVAGPIYFPSYGKGTPVIQIDKSNPKAALDAINQTWKALAPKASIELQFADRAYGNWLKLYSNFTDPLAFLMMVGIAIAVMGMIAIAAHTLHRRNREIGIRKSLGASSRDVFYLLLKDFAIPVIVAVVLVAWPIGWLLAREFLSWFPYRASLGIFPFFVSFLSTVLIAWLAVSIQSFKAARRRPAEVLRYE